MLGLAVTVIGSPAAWADSAVNEAVTINDTAPLPAAQYGPDVQLVPIPRGAVEPGDGGGDADGGQHLSVSLLGLGLAVGATVGVGAIVWRELRR